MKSNQVISTGLWAMLIVTTVSCGSGGGGSRSDSSSTPLPPLAPEPVVRSSLFEPADGHVLFLIGQDNESVGGNRNNIEPHQQWHGYLDLALPKPAGITSYIALADDSNSPQQNVPDGYAIAGLHAINNEIAGPSCLQCYLDSPAIDWSNTIVHLSIWYGSPSMVASIASGSRDYLIDEVVAFVGQHPEIPFFIRPGYEFEYQYRDAGVSAESYVQAFQRIVTAFKEAGLSNISFVFSAASVFTDLAEWQNFYPGDGYVDWVGYSFFDAATAPPANAGGLTFARQTGKPVMIAESCLHDHKITEASGEAVWHDYFDHLFAHIEAHPDLIKAFAYINADWSIQPMWVNDPFWYNTDSRLQNSSYISQQWQNRLASDDFITGEDAVFEMIGFEP
ncbi:hypothetical protein GCM10011369_32260 [Neiella marina]|uniref:GH26 domain-containing protein n=1 Tax=Neiella marina TaxID=508461 RepID=A0A8J2U949_9GAMM|nr:glycosyl hydrolase [Neiella marina]GGA87733.1 hypothetical protein GCM10011369_32260 [Neiella marina]